MSFNRKRSRQGQGGDRRAASPDVDSLLRIVLAPSHADGPVVELSANVHIVRSCCSCGEGLPKDAEDWDLSTLDICGRPAQRSTVVAWLNCAYNRICDRDFEEQPPAVHDAPLTTAAGLAKLLAFADAVGSRSGILAQCCSRMQDLVLAVPLPPPTALPNYRQTATLKTDGAAYQWVSDRYSAEDDEVLSLKYASPTATHSMYEVRLGAGARGVFLKDAAEQTEGLLYQALRLQLEPLAKHMLTFVAACTHSTNSIFYGRLEDIFTARVLEAALPANSTPELADLWISSVLSHPCGFGAQLSVNHLLNDPVHLSGPYSTTGSYGPYSSGYGGGYGAAYGGGYGYGRPRDPYAMEFMATLRQDFMGAAAGELVNVKLDLFDRCEMRMGDMTWPVQLLLGRRILNAEERQGLMAGGNGVAEPGSSDSDGHPAYGGGGYGGGAYA